MYVSIEMKKAMWENMYVVFIKSVDCNFLDKHNREAYQLYLQGVV